MNAKQWYQRRVHGDSAPQELIVSGRKGYNETMNGRYRKGQSLHQGRIYYAHTERKFVIRWCPVKKSWFFDWRGLNTDTTASAALAQDVQYPHLTTSAWRVFDGTNGFRTRTSFCVLRLKKQRQVNTSTWLKLRRRQECGRRYFGLTKSNTYIVTKLEQKVL
eukprot:TRINITY_DN4604_c0_g1_i1.p1 TRINITY_DN4604_c0_g1~~TRINITY_DN4604_c0_g1_i1.p1  ORF type:complete len:162 (+),score=21.00 TRINITY_DN4604_c0_g1_i1:19-504(+)